jgi:hypothetical protein
MGEHRNAGFWWRNLKEREHYEDLDIENMIILRYNSKKQDVDWTPLAQDRDMVMNPGIT